MGFEMDSIVVFLRIEAYHYPGKSVTDTLDHAASEKYQNNGHLRKAKISSSLQCATTKRHTIGHR